MTEEPTSNSSGTPKKRFLPHISASTFLPGRPAWLGDLRGSLTGFPVRRLLSILALLLAAIYILSGVYVVNPGEAAVVRRFGIVVQRRVEEGLHYRLPWPVDRVDVVNKASASLNRPVRGISTTNRWINSRR